MTTGSLQQPTVKNSEWIPGAEVGWGLGKGGKKRAGDQASERGGLREEGTGSQTPAWVPNYSPPLQEVHSTPGGSQPEE